MQPFYAPQPARSRITLTVKRFTVRAMRPDSDAAFFCAAFLAMAKVLLLR